MKEFQYIKIDEYGNMFYYKDKEMTTIHRTDGPAYESANGIKQWWVNGKIHRSDGPAIEAYNGDKEWWVNGKLHRTDGPAIEYGNGVKEWWLDDVKLTEEQFKSKIQPKISINGKDFTVEELNALIEAVKGK